MLEIFISLVDHMKDCQNDEKLLGMKAAEVILLSNKMLLFMQCDITWWYFIFCANCWVPYRVDPAHMHCQSSFMSLFQKSSVQVFFIYWEVTKAWKVWLLIMRSVPKSAAIFLGQWLRRVRHAETGKKEKKENKGHSALWAELKPRAFLGHWLWVRERAKTQKRESFS